MQVDLLKAEGNFFSLIKNKKSYKDEAEQGQYAAECAGYGDICFGSKVLICQNLLQGSTKRVRKKKTVRKIYEYQSTSFKYLEHKLMNILI